MTDRAYPVHPEELADFEAFQKYWGDHLEKRRRFHGLVYSVLSEK